FADFSSALVGHLPETTRPPTHRPVRPRVLCRPNRCRASPPDPPWPPPAPRSEPSRPSRLRLTWKPSFLDYATMLTSFRSTRYGACALSAQRPRPSALGVELGAQQQGEVDHPHPGESDDHSPDRPVGDVVAAEVVDVEHEAG